MSMGFTDRTPVFSGGKVVNRGPDSPPEEGAVRGEELGAAPNFGRRMERKMERARVFQRDMSKEGFFVGVSTSDLQKTRCQTISI
tara:strand:+ start:244 stop:498 length:255 start_codon:yes stop_codon:yes gene_type:complete